MESYKDQVAELQTQNNELIREKNRLDYELVQATKKLELMEDERLRDSDRIQLLEDHLQEAQLGSMHLFIHLLLDSNFLFLYNSGCCYHRQACYSTL